MIYFMPIIERFMSESIMDEKRLKAAKAICSCLNSTSAITNPLVAKKIFYDSLRVFLESLDYRRILLYLPFAVLQSASAQFKFMYMAAWYSLLDVHDVRGNFLKETLLGWTLG